MPELLNFALRVGNLATSLDFYTRIVGFPLREGGNDAADRAVIVDSDGDPWLLAGPNAGDLSDALAPNSIIFDSTDATLDFGWDGDLNTERDELLARGARAEDIAGPTTTRWGAVTLIVRDPDGYQLVFHGYAHLTHEQLLDLYLQGPDDLADALAGLNDADLDLAPETGGWSIRQIAHHVADGDDLWRPPIKVALLGPNVVYQQWYPGNEVMDERLDYAHRPIEPSLALLRAGRVYVAELLRSIPDAWEQEAQMRRGDAGEPRTLSVLSMLQTQTAHPFEHADEIRAIRQAHGK